MARKQREQQRRRKRGVLDVYPRGSRWWALVPGRGRVSLDIPLEGTSREEAYRTAAQRFATGGLDGRATTAAREGDLKKLSKIYIPENKHRWAARHIENVSYRLGAFIDALAIDGVSRIEQVTTQTLSRYVEGQHAKIGCTNDLTQRLDHIQTHNPEPAVLVAAFRGSSIVEARIHARLVDHRVMREWYPWTDEVQRVVMALAAEHASAPEVEAANDACRRGNERALKKNTTKASRAKAA